MTENMFDSTHQRMAKSSSNQISMYGKDFLDLVMEHGEINVEGGSSNRTPSNLFLNKIGYSNTVTPSKNSDLSSSHSHQINLQFSQYNKSYNKVEAEECNNSQAPKKLKYLEKCDKKPAKLNNFSNFLVPKVFLKSTQPPKKGSNCVTEFQDHQTSLNSNKSNKHVSFVARSDENCSLYNEPLMPSSPVCSIEASNDPNFCIKKHEESTYSSDNNEEEITSKSVKRGRNVKSHNLYEKKGRDKMNKKMRILKELIPNCNKVDKASLLDDAIAYLKNLKLQLQIMSMGNGLCIPQMMLTQLSGAGMGLNSIPSTGHNPWSIPQFSIPPFSSIKDNNKLGNMFGTFSNQMPQIPIPHHAPNNFIPIIIGNNSSTQLVPTTLEKPNFMDC